MSVLGNIRAGIVSRFDGTIACNQFTGYLLTPPEPPCFEIDFPQDTMLYHRGGADELQLVVRGIVSLGESDEAQAQLDKWLDPSGSDSVKACLEYDRTLGGACASLDVLSATGHRRLQTAEGTLFLCAEWTVGIYLT